jgi:hypothetical protein
MPRNKDWFVRSNLSWFVPSLHVSCSTRDSQAKNSSGKRPMARTALALDDKSLANGASLSTNFDCDRSIFRCNREEDVAAIFMRVGSDERWHVLITPPRVGARGGVLPQTPRFIRGQGSARSIICPYTGLHLPIVGDSRQRVRAASANTLSPISTRT